MGTGTVDRHYVGYAKRRREGRHRTERHVKTYKKKGSTIDVEVAAVHEGVVERVVEHNLLQERLCFRESGVTVVKSTPTRPHPYGNFHTRTSYGLGPGACALKAKLPGTELRKGWRQLCRWHRCFWFIFQRIFGKLSTSHCDKNTPLKALKVDRHARCHSSVK